jgi:hypothetical protein
VFGIGDNEIRLEASMYIIDVGFLWMREGDFLADKFQRGF